MTYQPPAAMFEDSLHSALDAAAALAPETELSFPSEGEGLILRELARTSGIAAGGLSNAGVKPSDRVAILCPNAPEFLQILFGISRFGAAACPLALPVGSNGMDAYLARLERITVAAGITHIVVSHRYTSILPTIATRLRHMTVISTDALLAGDVHSYATVRQNDLAIVQFTSGSTADPKGVCLTHGNVLAGIRAISSGIEVTQNDSGGFWLPLFHDMGLFATLTALLNGRPVSIWSPLDFVKYPDKWLKEFLEIGATISAGPNFGYDYLVAAFSPADVKALPDMSHWRVAFNGSETIDAEATEAFLTRFEPAGLRRETMFCVYGMAEATLAVTFPTLGQSPRFECIDGRALASGLATQCPIDAPRAKRIANVGHPVRGMHIRTVSLAGEPIDTPGVTGEVHIKGQSVMKGYLNGELHSLDPDGWFATGDLGYLRDGDLYVTGRIKEMITVRGENYYPDDVEGVVRSVPGIHKRRCVAFADDEKNQITVVAETAVTDTSEMAKLQSQISQNVRANLGIDISVYLVEPKTIPRTTSGKLQRLSMRTKIASEQRMGTRYA